MPNKWDDYSVSELLSLARVPWRELKRRGVDLEAVAHEAGVHGDAVLRARALRALARG